MGRLAKERANEGIGTLENFDEDATSCVERVGEEQQGVTRRWQLAIRERAQGDDDGGSQPDRGR
jgi:hypothetical protein